MIIVIKWENGEGESDVGLMIGILIGIMSGGFLYRMILK